MATATPIARKLALAQLAAFACNARAALAQAGIGDLEHVEIFRTHITARCCACDARPSPEVVAALLTGAPTLPGRRLRAAHPPPPSRPTFPAAVPEAPADNVVVRHLSPHVQ